MKKFARFRDLSAWNNHNQEWINPVQAKPIDRISELPDALISHILSSLSVKEAAVTSVLAKRWRFLWPDVPSLEFWGHLDFSNNSEKTRRFVDWVNRTLALRTEISVEKFGVGIMYKQRYSSDLDSWIEFAIKSRAKELVLLIHSNSDSYKLPDAIYSCSSLRSLHLRSGVVLAPRGRIEWKALTELCLENLKLNQGLVKEILSGCPVLYKLELKRCLGYELLKIESRFLRVLLVDDDEFPDEPELEISAPFVESLDISFYPDGRLVEIGDVRSLVKARINFNESTWYPSSEEVMEIAEDLFRAVNHAKELKLESEFYEVITMLAASGWAFPPSERCRLEVTSSRYLMYNISGIMALLESSPNLETFVLEGNDTDGLDPTANGDLDLDGDLTHLKTINIRNSADPNGEPVLTLARILLKRAIVLEYMEIVLDVVEIDDFIRIRQELLLFPRISRKAEVVVKQSRSPSKIA